MYKVLQVAVWVFVAVTIAVLVFGVSGCKPDCQNSVQSNGPGNMVNNQCDK